MSIATECPNCHKSYRLKDEFAGKRLKCSECLKPFVVPAAAAPPSNGQAKPTAKPAAAKPSADADALALAALADAPPPKPAENAPPPEGAPITVKCAFCDHMNQFPARMAGKNAPCQNDECRKIIKVPVPVKEDPKDWRTVKAKPTLARVDTNSPEGAWGNVQTTAVSREALTEAEAIGVAEVEPPNWRKRIIIGMAAVGVVGLLAVGGVWLARKRTATQQLDTMQEALNYVEANPNSRAKVEKLKGETAGLVYLLAARLDAHQGRPDKALQRLKLALGAIPPTAPDRQLARVEIADELAGLAGSKEEIDQKARLSWEKDKIGKEVGSVLTGLKSVPGDDGRDLRAHAVRVLTRRLIQRDQAHLAEVITGYFPEDLAEMQAVCGLELLAAGRRDDAEKLATRASGVPGETAGSLVALWMALASPDAPEDRRKAAMQKAQAVAKTTGDNVPAAVRAGLAAGLALQGKADEGWKQAGAAGKPEDRLRAAVAVTAVVVQAGAGDATKELTTCLQVLDGEFKGRKAPPWLVYRLVQLALKAGKPDLAAKSVEHLPDPGLKAWGQLDLLRARIKAEGKAETAWAGEVGAPSDLAHALAWAAVARRQAGGDAGAVAKEVKGWEKEPLKPFGYAGVALAAVPD